MKKKEKFCDIRPLVTTFRLTIGNSRSFIFPKKCKQIGAEKAVRNGVDTQVFLSFFKISAENFLIFFIFCYENFFFRSSVTEFVGYGISVLSLMG